MLLTIVLSLVMMASLFLMLKGQDHAEFFSLHPDEFCDQLETFIRVSG